MVLAETMQIDGGVVLAFLAVFAFLIGLMIWLLVVGTRTCYRAGRPGASAEDRLRTVPIIAIDLGFLGIVVKQGIDLRILTSPAALHGVGWLVGRSTRSDTNDKGATP